MTAPRTQGKDNRFWTGFPLRLKIYSDKVFSFRLSAGKRGKMYNFKESGERIAELRKKRGYTQESFADKVGLSYRSIADIERGYRGTSIDALIDMAEVLDTSIDYLVSGRESDINYLQIAEINDLLEKFSEEKKKLAFKMIRDIMLNLDSINI